MRLAAIFNVWADQILLEKSIRNISKCVDGVIVIYSTTSNFGEYDPVLNFVDDIPVKSHYFAFHPKKISPRENETEKRNVGLQKARELGFTHVLMMDADEFYRPEDVEKEKKRFDDTNLLGLVCRVKCYFKLPTLTIGYDTTLVPFIHKLTPDLGCCFNKNYPFAWTDTDGVPFTPQKRIRIDPTRSYSITSGVEWSEITMHHYSWVRDDIKKKIRNSTARENIERSTIVQDYLDAKAGAFCKFYGRTLEECPNVFGIPHLIDSDVKSLQ